MKSESDEILELEAALRDDLAQRTRRSAAAARLAGLGLGVGVTLTSATAAALAGSKSTAPAGLWGFLGSLPLGAKVGIASVVTASAVAGPVYYTKSQAPVATVPAKQATTQPVRARPRSERRAPCSRRLCRSPSPRPARHLPRLRPSSSRHSRRARWRPNEARSVRTHPSFETRRRCLRRPPPPSEKRRG